VHGLHGGTKEAERYLDDFIDQKLDHFAELRNDPSLDTLSNMSPYLHFGQISPLYVALRISREASPGKEAYLEELIVRRELSMNYVFYNPQYDSFEGLPEWAKKTLSEHGNDGREYTYTLKDLEGEKTHDPYWNAAQKEMRVTGKMHGYMRMYWGKKILEWSRTPEEGFKNALFLNNKYELDGRDPSGFTGVAWCFGKHDRPWGERKIFGKVRYMNAAGLKRKFNVEGYLKKVDLLGKG
jgi:deoxyribodipyrimidine photo-lyase